MLMCWAIHNKLSIGQKGNANGYIRNRLFAVSILLVNCLACKSVRSNNKIVRVSVSDTVWACKSYALMAVFGLAFTNVLA